MTELNEMTNLSEDGIEVLYSCGYNFYEGGQYEKAMHFFRLLTLADMDNRKHWMGLGASYQMLKQYEYALQSYAQAALLDENDPLAHWHAAECLKELGHNKQAKKALKSAETVAKRQPKQYDTLLERIALIKEKKKG